MVLNPSDRDLHYDVIIWQTPFSLHFVRLLQATLLSQAQILNSLSRDEDLDSSSLIKKEARSKTCMKHVKIGHFKNLSIPTPFSIFLVHYPLSVLINFLSTCHVHVLLPTPISLYTHSLLPIYICFSPTHSNFISLCVVLLHNLINSELALIETRSEITCTEHSLHSVLKT